jgi:uncharacterized protein with PQ loop repeat
MDRFLKFEKRVEKGVAPYIDELFYLGGIISPIIAMPQAYKIFVNRSAESVALETWVLYFLGALCMCTYGLVHKQKPILFMNLTVLPVYILIIVGIILYS